MSLQMDDQTRTDADLTRAWEGGDERGYETIVNRYAPMVFARCRRALGVADADDATQAVFLVLARKRAQAAASPALAAWLSTVAENVVRNAKRDRERRRRAESSTPTPVSSPAIEETDMHGLSEHLDACVAELPKHEREAVVLHHLANHSIADVARHTGSGLSTVKERLNRGLEKLRKLLSARGVELGMAPLLAQLQAESAAPVPHAVLDHLHRITSISTKAGLTGTTAALSARVVRWSHQGLSPMTYVAIIGTPLLLTLGAVGCSLFAAEPAAPAAAASRPAITARALAGFDISVIDPEKAHTWHVVRWNDGARTAERARRLPELALLPESGATLLAQVGSVSEGTLAINLETMFPDADRVRQFALQKELATLPLQEQSRRFHDEMIRAIAEANQDSEATRVATGVKLPTLDGSVVVAEGSLARERLDQFLAGELPLFEMAVQPGDGGWNLHGSGGDYLVARTGARFDLRSTTSGRSVAVPADQLGSMMPTADIEMSMLVDPGTAGPIQTMGSISMTVTPDGLRLVSTTPWGNAEQSRAAASGTRVDRRRFTAIPAPAFMAAVVAMTPGETATSVVWQSMLDGMMLPLQQVAERDPAKAQMLTVAKAAAEALRSVDGDVAAWLEPGSPLPMVTIEADMPKAAADALIASTGQTPDADGTVFVSAGMAMIWIGWQDGRLICTTNPGGIAAIDRSGGFTAQPDIVRALAAMPEAAPSFCVLMRPATMVHTAAPFVGMFAGEQMPKVAEYEKRLNAESAYGFLTVVPSSEGVRMEASGMLALIGGAYLAAQMSPKHANN